MQQRMDFIPSIDWFSRGLGHYTRPRPSRSPASRRTLPSGIEDPGYCKGLENSNEFVNIARWMIKHGYSDREITKVVSLNALKLLEKV